MMSPVQTCLPCVAHISIPQLQAWSQTAQICLLSQSVINSLVGLIDKTSDALSTNAYNRERERAMFSDLTTG